MHNMKLTTQFYLVIFLRTLQAEHSIHCVFGEQTNLAAGRFVEKFSQTILF